MWYRSRTKSKTPHWFDGHDVRRHLLQASRRHSTIWGDNGKLENSNIDSSYYPTSILSAILCLRHRTKVSTKYLSPCLWNQLPLSLRQPHFGTSYSIPDLPIPSPITSSSSDSPLCSLHIYNSLSFHYRLKTYLFHKSYPRSFTSSSRTAFTDYCLDYFFWATRFCFFILPLFFVSVLD